MAQQKRMTRTEKVNTPINEALKRRVLDAKEKLPKSGITSFFLQLSPEYDNVKGRSLLNNVLQTRTTNEDITERLEDLAKLANPKDHYDEIEGIAKKYHAQFIAGEIVVKKPEILNT